MSVYSKSLTLNCNAKINLALDVISKRPDGYHNIELIYTEIPLCDTASVSLRGDGEIHLSCSDPTIPHGHESLTYRTAVAFFKAINSSLGADISLINRIPNEAGLAGASADAAGVLRALNTLTGANLSTEELMQIGAKLGADIPFCILGGCALGEGIGEILTPLPAPPELFYVIVKPPESVSTAWVYQNLDISDRIETLCVQAVAEGIRRGDMEMIAINSGNVLETVTAKKFPVIHEIKKILKDNGAALSLMSGSGTSVFGAFVTMEAAENAISAVKHLAKEIYLV